MSSHACPEAVLPGPISPPASRRRRRHSGWSVSVLESRYIRAPELPPCCAISTVCPPTVRPPTVPPVAARPSTVSGAVPTHHPLWPTHFGAACPPTVAQADLPTGCLRIEVRPTGASSLVHSRRTRRYTSVSLWPALPTQASRLSSYSDSSPSGLSTAGCRLKPAAKRLLASPLLHPLHPPLSLDKIGGCRLAATV